MKKENEMMSAFTLIEVLLVIALIAILAAITIIAINPAKNFADARDTQRQSDVTQILNAVTQFTSESGQDIGDLGTIATCPLVTDIVTSAPLAGDVDLAASLVDEYLVAIPEDPTGATGNDTGYDICQSSNGRVTVSAPSAENSTISVKR